jgi:hypothetical protein
MDYLTMEEAAASLPNKPHPVTVARWARHGIRGVRLKSVVFGRQRYTTRAYLEEFGRQLGQLESPAQIPPGMLQKMEILLNPQACLPCA